MTPSKVRKKEVWWQNLAKETRREKPEMMKITFGEILKSIEIVRQQLHNYSKTRYNARHIPA